MRPLNTLYDATRNAKAFSLVELSIVLVILGLLVGGVLSGQSLIRASELRAVNTEYQKYTTAIGTFRDKYFAIPGDFNNATGLGWGSYNGDADGIIELGAFMAPSTNETSTFWIHLSSAGMIEGTYVNVGNVALIWCGTMTPGTNNPKSKLSSGGWNILGLNTIDAGTQTYYASSYGNALLLGGGTTCGFPVAMAGIVKAEEAWNIDTKIDDGKPDLGNMLTFESQGSATAGSGCGNQDADTSAIAASDYDLANPSKTACAMVFKTGY